MRIDNNALTLKTKEASIRYVGSLPPHQLTHPLSFYQPWIYSIVQKTCLLAAMSSEQEKKKKRHVVQKLCKWYGRLFLRVSSSSTPRCQDRWHGASSWSLPMLFSVANSILIVLWFICCKVYVHLNSLMKCTEIKIVPLLRNNIRIAIEFAKLATLNAFQCHFSSSWWRDAGSMKWRHIGESTPR